VHDGRLSRKAATLVAALLAAAPGGAAPARPGPLRVGPVFLTPSLRLSAGVDTNVFNQLVSPVADTGFVLTPAVSYRARVNRRLNVYGEGLLGVNYFTRATGENFTNRSASVNGELQLGRLTIAGGASGGQFRDRFSILVDNRTLRNEERYFAAGRLLLSSRFTATGEVRRESFRYGSLGGTSPARLRDALDRDTDLVRVGLERRLTRKTKAFALFEDAEERFRVPLADGSRSVPSRRFLVGVETGRRAAVSGRLLAGLRRFPGVGAPEYTGPVFTLEAQVPLEVVRVGLSAQRDVTYAVQTGELVPVGLPTTFGQRNLYLLRSYRLEIEGALPAELLVRGYAGLEQGRALLPDALGTFVFRRGDRRVSAGVALLRRLGDAISVGGFVERARRISNAPGFSYDGWRYGVEANVTP
jgi:hypothetical protein